MEKACPHLKEKLQLFVLQPVGKTNVERHLQKRGRTVRASETKSKLTFHCLLKHPQALRSIVAEHCGGAGTLRHKSTCCHTIRASTPASQQRYTGDQHFVTFWNLEVTSPCQPCCLTDADRRRMYARTNAWLAVPIRKCRHDGLERSFKSNRVNCTSVPVLNFITAMIAA